MEGGDGVQRGHCEKTETKKQKNLTLKRTQTRKESCLTGCLSCVSNTKAAVYSKVEYPFQQAGDDHGALDMLAKIGIEEESP